MIKITGQVSIPYIDRDKYERALLQRVEQILTASMKQFVKKAYGRIPVDTGMARGSLVPLGRYLGETVIVNPMRQVRTDGPYIKSKQQGEAQGQDFGIRYSGTVISFVWRSQVFHYFLNEQFKIKNVSSSPWDSLPIGISAAVSHIRRYYADALPVMSASIRTRFKRWKTFKLG